MVKRKSVLSSIITILRFFSMVFSFWHHFKNSDDVPHPDFQSDYTLVIR
jgi:hypothetical protein